MSVFSPAARATGPDGRDWEIYAYRLQLSRRGAPDPAPVGIGVPSYAAESAFEVFDGVVYVLAWIPRLLLRLLVDLPRAVLRLRGSDEWTIEAISWAPSPTTYRWSTTREFRGQVLAQVEAGLVRGDTPHPRNATFLGRVPS